MIVGLGNPGARYRSTRHNLGFDVLDRLAEAMGASFDREKCEGLIAEHAHRGQKVLLVKPLTYMNRSGDCVAKLARNKVHDPADLLVVVDDVNLPLGRLRARAGGSAGGHNGLKSLIERTGSKDFHRLRLGVGDDRRTGDLSDHVLERFRPDEREAVEEMTGRAVDAVRCWIEEGVEKTMDRFNR